jgi:hypothetical protein
VEEETIMTTRTMPIIVVLGAALALAALFPASAEAAPCRESAADTAAYSALLGSQGRYDGAEALSQPAFAIFKLASSPDHDEIAVNSNRLGATDHAADAGVSYQRLLIIMG